MGKMRVALCAVGKLENHYIREWVEHHKKIGVHKIFIYDNNNIDGEKFEDVIEDYVQAGYVDVVNKRGRGFRQSRFYRECYKKQSPNFDWIGFIDIDEFIVLNERFSNISSFLSLPIFDGFDYIKLNWRTFTDSGKIMVENEDYGCLNRFKEYINNPRSPWSRRCKGIYKTSNNQVKRFLNVHCAYSDDLVSCNDVGERVNRNGTMTEYSSYVNCWINHYPCKTLEEYVNNKLKKHNIWSRPGDSGYEFYIKDRLANFGDFWEINDKTPEKMEYIEKNFKNEI